MKIIGHRGAKGLAPENSPTAMRKALEHDVDMIEIDLRLTQDTVLVVLHDPILRDASGSKLVVAETDYEELITHKPDLATLGQIINGVDREVPLIIEVKDPAAVELLIISLKHSLKEGWRPKDFMVSSFHFEVLKKLHAELPEIPLIVNEKWSGVRAGWRARRVRTKTVAMNQRWLWWGFIRSVKRSGWQLYAYTLNDTEKARRWKADGLAGVITDFPDRFESN